MGSATRAILCVAPGPIRRLGCRHSQPPIEFPCSAPQRDGKLPKNARQSEGMSDIRMRRRDLFLIISIASGLWPFAALGEPQKVPRVGVLVVGSAGSERFWQIFRKLMEERGYIDGQTVHYEFRSDQGQVKRLPELAAELIHLKVDVLVTWFTPAAKAAQDATREIPIVMALAGNPVETGLVKSLAHPGGNITGLAGVGAELAGKSVELIREMLPTASRIAALANAPDPFSKPFTEYILLAGAATRTEIYPVMVQRTEELSDAFATMKENRIDAFIVQPSLPTTRVAALAVEHRI